MSNVAVRQAPLTIIRNLEHAPAESRPAVLAHALVDTQHPDGSWQDGSEGNHEALAAMLRDNTFERDPRLTASLKATVAKSWEHLTGHPPTEANLLAPLPGRKALAETVLASQKPDGSWGGSVDASVLNHVAIAGLLRRRSMDGDPALVARLDGALRQSWRNLTGSVPKGEKVLGPLPNRKALSRTSAATATFHEVMLGSSVEVRLHPAQVLARAEAYEAGAPAPKPSHTGRVLGVAGALATGAAAVAFPEAAAVVATTLSHVVAAAALPVAHFVAGFMAGWTESAYAESLIHDKVHHAEKEFRDSWAGMGQAGEYMKEGYISHMGYHHGSTFKQDHVTQFTSPEEKAKITEKLIKSGRQGVVDDDFGMTLSWKGCLQFIGVGAPAYVPTLTAANAWIWKFAPTSTGEAIANGLAFNIGFAIPVALYPLQSKFVHRFTHMKGTEMVQKAPTAIRLYLMSKLGRFVTSHHMVHHDDDTRSTGPLTTHEGHEVKNTNLMPPIGDLLRGTLHRPTVEQQEKMRKLGMLYY